uniref:Uncharacterized protein n=1 Tax=viral metagenome TaxID=1070528 RepID=A0A6C0J6X5_9ZZZZ
MSSFQLGGKEEVKEQCFYPGEGGHQAHANWLQLKAVV